MRVECSRGSLSAAARSDGQSFSVSSFRSFNLVGWNVNKITPSKFSSFVHTFNPDVFCTQEGFCVDDDGKDFPKMKSFLGD